MDHERSAVAAAELVAFDGTDLETVVALDVVVERIRAVTAGEWWPGPAVGVVPARRDALSSSARCVPAVGASHDVQIRLARPQMTLATAAHELAHALAGVGAGHDAMFRTAYVDVVAVLTNADPTDRRHRLHVDQLVAAFHDADLTLAARTWPAPPDDTTGAIAL